MDKSFNEQELSDIMKEIEALEEDLTTSPAESSTASMEEELAQLESEEVEDQEDSILNVVPLESKREARQLKTEQAPTSAGTSMSFKVQGNITLDLQFDVGGKIVSLEVSETGLAIELDGGMKFTLPIGEPSRSKKVA